MSKIIFVFCVFLSSVTVAQQVIEGAVVDPSDNSPLIGVNLLLTSQADSTDRYFATSEIDGSFRFSQVKTGSYVLDGTYVGYKKLVKSIKVERKRVDLGNV